MLVRKKIYSEKIEKIKAKEEMEKYLKKRIIIEKLTAKDNIIKTIEEKISDDDRLWILVGCKENRWECLQVATSKNVKTEICADIDVMFSSEYKKLIAMDKHKKLKPFNTQFYKNVYMKHIGEDKNAYIYGKIREGLLNDEYDSLGIYVVDYEKFLSFEGKMFEGKKLDERYAAEALFAFQTQAIYWNAYRGGDDMKALNVLLQINQ